jgi:sugar phosphate isomerase/epimerase
MKLGIFAKTFPRASFAETLDAVASHGLSAIQINFSCIGLPAMPAHIDPTAIASIRADRDRHGMEIVGVSGTFNMIHPDISIKSDGFARLAVLAKATRQMGCNLVTLCTGTRDLNDMWSGHPDNESPAAWRDLRESIDQAVAIADEHDLFLGIEPETSNVVSSARKARQLLDETKSQRLKIIIDPANLFHGGRIERLRETIAEALQLLGPDIIMAHAKELAADGTLGGIPPGRGILDWHFYVEQLMDVNFNGPLVMHGLNESDVAEGTTFLQRTINS